MCTVLSEAFPGSSCTYGAKIHLYSVYMNAEIHYSLCVVPATPIKNPQATTIYCACKARVFDPEAEPLQLFRVLGSFQSHFFSCCREYMHIVAS